MHHPEHRSWIPVILIGLSALIIIVFIVWGEPVAESGREIPPHPIAEEGEEVDPEEYKATVATIMDGFEETQNAGQTYEELLNVTVPSEFRNIHLELVIAMSEWRSGKTESATARLDFLRQQVDWLQ